MNITLLALTLIPIMVFVYLETRTNYRKAIKGAIASSVVLGIILSFMLGRFDYYLVGELALIVIFGVIALKIDSEQFFRYQPALFNLLLLFILLIHHFTGKPIMVYIVEISTETQLVSQAFDLSNPEIVAWLSKLSWAVFVSIFMQMILMAYAAYRWSNLVWAICRGLGFYLFAFTCLLVFASMHPMPQAISQKLMNAQP